MCLCGYYKIISETKRRKEREKTDRWKKKEETEWLDCLSLSLCVWNFLIIRQGAPTQGDDLLSLDSFGSVWEILLVCILERPSAWRAQLEKKKKRGGGRQKPNHEQAPSQPSHHNWTATATTTTVAHRPHISRHNLCDLHFRVGVVTSSLLLYSSSSLFFFFLSFFPFLSSLLSLRNSLTTTTTSPNYHRQRRRITNRHQVVC